jgi:hypothetical protein
VGLHFTCLAFSVALFESCLKFVMTCPFKTLYKPASEETCGKLKQNLIYLPSKERTQVAIYSV